MKANLIFYANLTQHLGRLIMCYNPMSIRSVSKNAPLVSLIPCGKCEECRQMIKNNWSVRLALSFQHAQQYNFKLFFFTLTYNDNCIPHFTESCFIENCYIPNVPCFNRQDVSKFMENMRHWLSRTYNVSRFPWFIGADIGKNTRRPHYHGIFALPSCVDDEILHNAIKTYWTLGFVFPRHYLGGTDSHGYNHKPFRMVTDPVKAAFYASKYCCKSLAYLDITRDCRFNTKSLAYKRSRLFHLQSKSIGYDCIANMSDEDKLNFLRDGISLIGQDRRFYLPVYFKNKILFNPLYVTTRDGRRLVRREVSDFFLENYEQIFDIKVNQYRKLFIDFLSKDYWNNCVENFPVQSKSVVGEIVSLLNLFKFNAETLAVSYIAYFGCPSVRINALRPVDFWFSRYFTKKTPFVSSLDESQLSMYLCASQVASFYLQLLNFLNEDETDEKKLLEQVKDFHATLNEV